MEYVRFNRDQYVDTGIDQLGNTKIEVTFEATQTQAITFVLGSRSLTSGATLYNTRQLTQYNSASGFVYLLGDNSGNTVSRGTKLGPTDTAKHTAVLEDNTATFDGVATTNSAQSAPTVSPYSMYLGTTNHAGAPASGYQYFSGNIYDFKIWKNGALVAEYVPVCPVGTTTNCGFWDTVTDSIKTSATSTSLDGGNPTGLQIDDVTSRGQPCDSLNVISATVLRCVPPPSILGGDGEGLVDVVVTFGNDVATLQDGYLYSATDITRMSIANVNPRIGPTSGGTELTIAGSDFLPTSVTGFYDVMEYLQFTNAQYVDTGIDQLGDTKVEVTFEASQTSAITFIFGVRSRVSGGTVLHNSRQITQYNNSSGFLYILADSSGLPAVNNTSLGPTDTVKHTAVLDDATATFDGVTTTNPLQSIPTEDPYPIYLGTTNDAGSPASGFQRFSGKIYSFKIWKGVRLVADYIPVCPKGTTVNCGFWDTVSATFKGNNGTGVLSGGGIGDEASLVRVTLDEDNVPANCKISSVSNTAIVCDTSAHNAGLVDVAVVSGTQVATNSAVQSSPDVLPTGGFLYRDISLSLSVDSPGSDDKLLISTSPTMTASAEYLTAAVATNNPFGYKLSLFALDSNLVCDMYPEESDVANPRFSSIGVAGELSPGEWGWNWRRLSGTPSTWTPLPLIDSSTDSKLIVSTSAPSAFAGGAYFVWFGAKAAWAQPPCDEYRGTIVFTAVAN